MLTEYHQVASAISTDTSHCVGEISSSEEKSDILIWMILSAKVNHFDKMTKSSDFAISHTALYLILSLQSHILPFIIKNKGQQ